MKENNFKIEYKGKTFLNQGELAKYLGISTSCLQQRIKRGVPEENWDKKNLYGIKYKGKYFKIMEFSG